MTKFGTLPRRRFTPPAPSRGGRGAFYVEPEAPLVGTVNDLKASAAEERFSRSLRKSKRVRSFMFRTSPGVPKGAPGWKELDWLIFTAGQVMAIMFQETSFVHKTGADQEQDKLNQIILLQRLRQMGIDVPKIQVVNNDKFITQASSDAEAKRLGVL